MNVRRHDADLAFARRNDAGTIRADQARLGMILQDTAHARIMSAAGMPSVMQTTSAMPASAASMIASAANGGGTKITEALAPVAFTRFGDGIEHRQVQMLLAALARRDAAHHFGAVGDGLLGVERAFLAGEALHQQARVVR